MNSPMTLDLNLTARDVSGQRAFSLRRYAGDGTIAELVRKLVTRMGLATEDSSGRPHLYRAFLDREARHLHGSELVGDSLKENDELVLQPEVQAGRD